MINFIITHADSILIGIICFLAGNHLGHKIGFNDGLRRAFEIISGDTVHQSPLGDKRKT